MKKNIKLILLTLIFCVIIIAIPACQKAADDEINDITNEELNNEINTQPYTFQFDTYDDHCILVGYHREEIVTEINIPATYNDLPVTGIVGAFSSDLSLTTATIPDSVTHIGMDTFSFCYNLKTVIFGNNSQLKTIGNRAFY